MRIYKAFINTVICFLAFITFTFISVSFITPQKLNAQEMNISSSRLITVLIPGLSLNDLSRFPNLTHLSQASAIGLMNTRNDGARKISSAYLSISTGIRASCPESAAFGLQKNETYNKIEAQKLYERYTGNFPKSNEILVPYLNLICNTNTTEVTPGLLGHRLKENNISFSFIGNQDLPGNIMRPGVLIAMDKAGTIKQGFVGESTYIISNYSPTIYTTNYPFFIEEAAHFFDENTRLIFMDLGDLARLDSLYNNLSHKVYKTNRDKLLKEMDDFLGVLISYCQEKSIPLFLVTPFPAKEDLLKGNSLTPTIYYTGKNESKGLLYSSSTKREGILTNLDIAPSILNILGTNHQTLFRGSPIAIKPHNSSLIYLEKQLDTFVRNYSQRPFIIKSYVLSLIILVLLNLFFIITSNTFLPLVSDFLLSLTSVPLFFLLLPLLDIKQVALIFLLFFGTTLATLIFLKKVTTTLHGLTFIYLVTSLFIIFDLILGSPLMKSSLLGYDPISGSRYYGLGNEYLGVLLGSSVLGFTLFLEMLKKKNGCIMVKQLFPTLGFLLIIIVFIVATPQLGTNVGGAITFSVTYLLLYSLLLKKRFSFQSICKISLIALAFLIFLFYFDLQRPVNMQSHIGQTAHLLQVQGIDALYPILERKISMNIKLMRYSLWSKVFLTFFVSLVLIFNKPPGLIEKIFNKYTFLKAGFYAGLFGSFVILIVNDSGIVAAATSMLYIAPVLLYLVSLDIGTNNVINTD